MKRLFATVVIVLFILSIIGCKREAAPDRLGNVYLMNGVITPLPYYSNPLDSLDITEPGMEESVYMYPMYWNEFTLGPVIDECIHNNQTYCDKQ